MLSPQERLKTLRKTYETCMQCPLSLQGRSCVVFGSGDSHAALMLIGEAPGRDEDAQGLPFVGRAGKLLTDIIQTINLTRDQVYISNVVKCRPPNNRAPQQNESDTCKNLILFKEIELIKPKIICTLGSIATQALLGNHIRISQARGKFFAFKNTPVMPTYHPAYLLRSPSKKSTVMQDFEKITEKLCQK